MTVPANPKIYHIVHIDKLPSIIGSGGLLSDAQVQQANNNGAGTNIGMDHIKARRLNELTLTSHPGLFVGKCVPFYFCPRSVMLYVISKGNHSDINYQDGQNKILHLEADLQKTVTWAQQNSMRWAFTSSNAGSYYFDDWNDLQFLNQVDWSAISARSWARCSEAKQAEFLIENSFPYGLIERIGTQSVEVATQVMQLQQGLSQKPSVVVENSWYY